MNNPPESELPEAEARLLDAEWTLVVEMALSYAGYGEVAGKQLQPSAARVLERREQLKRGPFMLSSIESAAQRFMIDYLSDQNPDIAERDSWIQLCEAFASRGIDVFELADKKAAAGGTHP